MNEYIALIIVVIGSFLTITVMHLKAVAGYKIRIRRLEQELEHLAKQLYMEKVNKLILPIEQQEEKGKKN
jgi:hypothetical protein